MKMVMTVTEEGLIDFQCDECYELFEEQKAQTSKCPYCGNTEVEPLSFPNGQRLYAAANRNKDGSYGGVYRLHLNQPLPEARAANQPRAPKPTPAVACFYAAFRVTPTTELGSYTGKLDAIGIIRHLVPHLRSGKVRDISYGDPLSSRDQEGKAKSEEHRRMALLKFENLHMKILLETSKDKKKKLSDRKRKWAAIAFQCPWCKKDYLNISGLDDRAKRINAHTRQCKGRPNEEALDKVMKTHFGDFSEVIPQEFRDPSTNKTISTHADDPTPGKLPE